MNETGHVEHDYTFAISRSADRKGFVSSLILAGTIRVSCQVSTFCGTSVSFKQAYNKQTNLSATQHSLWMKNANKLED